MKNTGTLLPGSQWRYLAHKNIRVTVHYVEEFHPGEMHVFFTHNDEPRAGVSMWPLRLWFELMQPCPEPYAEAPTQPVAAVDDGTAVTYTKSPSPNSDAFFEPLHGD